MSNINDKILTNLLLCAHARPLCIRAICISIKLHYATALTEARHFDKVTAIHGADDRRSDADGENNNKIHLWLKFNVWKP